MDAKIQVAETEAQREAIYRLRYDIYVEEMNRYGAIADHQNRRLVEPDDAWSRLYFAAEGADIVGTMRLTWGGDGRFGERHIEQYDLAPFIAELPPEQIVIGERFMVAKAYRGSDLIFRFFRACLEFVNAKRIQLIFGDCEPHLLNLYHGLGFRTYTRRNVNSAEAGYLIPLVMVPEDMDYMRAIDSPLMEMLEDFGPDARLPECLPRLLAQGSGVKSQRLTAPESYARDIQSALRLAESRAQLFDGLGDSQIQRCLSKSSAIECRKGDRLIKKGNVARNMFVVLSGTLEIRDGDVLVGVSSAGDIVGEMAFLLESPRSMDVYAATADVSVLSLSEAVIKEITQEDPKAAARLLLNVSKMLCYKLLRTNA